MSSSTLVAFTQLSPNHSGRRTYPLTRVSVHCYVGQVTAERMGRGFASPEKKASCTYGVDKDGRIGQFVDEENRSWCTSSADNDNRAITIEVACDSTHPYAVTGAAYNALIDLLVDICRRNGKRRLVWLGDKAKSLAYKTKEDELLMTVHRWFANKACPGEYLYTRHGEIAMAVTEKLKEEADMTAKEVQQMIDTAVTAAVQGVSASMVELGKQLRAELTPKVYKTPEDVPDWGRPTVDKLVAAGQLQGDEKGNLNLTHDLLRALVVANRQTE